jgi:hypothetical protein
MGRITENMTITYLFLTALASLTIATGAQAEYDPNLGYDPTQAAHDIQPTTYVGYVGQRNAIFYLNWLPNGRISGTYYYPGRNRTYDLSGNNFKEGEVYLDEYTDGELTARIGLTKYIVANQIVWTGIMQNTDGRRFEISFSRSQ